MTRDLVRRPPNALPAVHNPNSQRVLVDDLARRVPIDGRVCLLTLLAPQATSTGLPARLNPHMHGSYLALYPGSERLVLATVDDTGFLDHLESRDK